jgi:hypothetical protein
MCVNPKLDSYGLSTDCINNLLFFTQKSRRSGVFIKRRVL